MPYNTAPVRTSQGDCELNLYFDDVEVGDTESLGPYELGREEIIDFATKYDPERFHTDETFADHSIYRGLTASSSQMFPIAYALSHRSANRVSILAPLGIDEVTFPNPARPGDKLYYSMEIIDKIESRSKRDRGILKARITLSNEAGATVLDYKHTLLVARKTP